MAVHFISVIIHYAALSYIRCHGWCDMVSAVVQPLHHVTTDISGISPLDPNSQLYVSSSSTLQSNLEVGGRSPRDVTDQHIFSKIGRLRATICLSVWMKFSRILHILLPVWIKFGKGNVPSTSNCRGSASHTLWRGGCESLSVPAVLPPGLAEISGTSVTFVKSGARETVSYVDSALIVLWSLWCSESTEQRVSLWSKSCSTPLAVLTEMEYVYCAVRTDFLNIILIVTDVPWLRRLVAGLSLQRPQFDPKTVHLWYVVCTITLVQVFLRVLRFSLDNITPPVHHICLYPHVVLSRRTNGRNLGTLYEQNTGASDRKLNWLLLQG